MAFTKVQFVNGNEIIIDGEESDAAIPIRLYTDESHWNELDEYVYDNDRKQIEYLNNLVPYNDKLLYVAFEGSRQKTYALTFDDYKITLVRNFSPYGNFINGVFNFFGKAYLFYDNTYIWEWDETRQNWEYASAQYPSNLVYDLYYYTPQLLAATANNRTAVVMNRFTFKCYTVDIDSWTWTQLRDVPGTMQVMSNPSIIYKNIFSHNGDIYIFGLGTDNHYYVYMYKYIAAANVWTVIINEQTSESDLYEDWPITYHGITYNTFREQGAFSWNNELFIHGFLKASDAYHFAIFKYNPTTSKYKLFSILQDSTYEFIFDETRPYKLSQEYPGLNSSELWTGSFYVIWNYSYNEESSVGPIIPVTRRLKSSSYYRLKRGD